jgi:hypothetical protein
MTAHDKAAPPFDIFSLSKDMQERFGWSNDDLNRVMEHLMPAALSGFQHFGMPSTGMPDWFSQAEQLSAGSGNPFADYAKFFQAPTQQTLTPFFGPEAVQQAVAAQISTMTGVQRDAVQELMPVAATLAFGQVARPFLQGEAQVLLDAYLRGFARGRPKRAPAPIDYLQGYTEAMNAFWGSFLQPAAARHAEDEAELEPELEDDLVDDEVEEDEASEFDEMVSGWMSAGRDLQSSQFKAFDDFFATATKNLGK